jgi:hypothetical protein
MTNLIERFFRSLQVCILCTLGSALAPSLVSAQCLAADAHTTNMIRYLSALVTATASDTESVTIRTSYNLPVVAPTQIAVVTKSSICTKALAAYAAALPAGLTAPTSVYVVKVGSTYVVWPQSMGTQSEFIMRLVMDSHYTTLAKFAG